MGRSSCLMVIQNSDYTMTFLSLFHFILEKNRMAL